MNFEATLFNVDADNVAILIDLNLRQNVSKWFFLSTVMSGNCNFFTPMFPHMSSEFLYFAYMSASLQYSVCARVAVYSSNYIKVILMLRLLCFL